MSFAAKAAARQGMEMAKEKVSQATSKSEINWNDYNFPPLLKLFHFNLSELSDPQRFVASKIYIEWIVFLSVLLFNFVNTIVLVADGAHGLNILYSILNSVLGSVLVTYLLYCG
ncbi:MAG: hypothetical protein V2I33_17630, partial [Kangiellaceae bacterium]|nr:hypothetical protein [Kangiellaceae bacterium]